MRSLPANCAFTIMVGVTLWIFSQASAAAEKLGTEAACPSVIAAESFKPSSPPAGWTGFVPTQMHLSAAGMMAGPPDSMAYLVPSKQSQDTQTWLFEKGEEKWLWCSYGGTGAVQLSRRLSDLATSCTLTSVSMKQDGIVTLRAVLKCK